MDDTPSSDPIDPHRAELTHRMKELLDVPHVGKLARKLRKRAGLSLEDLGYRIDVAPEDIKEAEKTGLLRSVGLNATMRMMGLASHHLLHRPFLQWVDIREIPVAI